MKFVIEVWGEGGRIVLVVLIGEPLLKMGFLLVC